MLIVIYRVDDRIEIYGPFDTKEWRDEWIRHMKEIGCRGSFILASLKRPDIIT